MKVQFGYTPGQTLTAKRFTETGTTSLQTSSGVTSSGTVYVAEFSGTVAAGRYRIAFELAGTEGGYEYYTVVSGYDAAVPILPDSELALARASQIPANFTDATFVSAGVLATAALANAPAVFQLTGPFTRTITVTDSITNAPIEGAAIRIFRTGESESQLTNVSGVAVFTTGAFTFTYAITKGGYAGTSGTIAVTANGSTPIALVATVVATPADPALATLPVLTVDDAGAPEVGVKVYARLVAIPVGSTGIVFDGKAKEATSGVGGSASFTVVKGATYELRRGTSKQWLRVLMTSSSVQATVSFIGVDGA